MITIGLFTIIGIYLFYKISYYSENIFFILFSMFIGGFMFALLGCFTAFLIPSNSYTLEKESEIEILSINDNNTFDGSFILGNGSVDNEMCYMYYYKTENGIKFGKVNANETYIVYNDSLSPMLIKYWKKDNSLFSLKNTGYEYKLIVPSNSIVKQFNFDLR